MTRAEIVEIARSWIGTKWQHQAHLKGVACDCVGLIREVYIEASGQQISPPTDYPRSWHLFKNEERLYPLTCKFAEEIPITEARPGDILIFGFKRMPAAHLGIMASADTFIHTYDDVGKVVESRLDATFRRSTWRGHIRAAFRFPGVID